MTEQRTAGRVVITGASGVGKTSLATALGQQLQIPTITEVARQLCAEQNYNDPTQIPDQEAFRLQVLQQQLAAESQHQNYVSDRSTIDAWVLWQRWQLCSAMTYTSESYYESCRERAKTYTHVIYIPPLFPVANDGFRWAEPDYIKQIDRLTRQTLYDWQLWERTYTIKTDQLAARLTEVQEWLRG